MSLRFRIPHQTEGMACIQVSWLFNCSLFGGENKNNSQTQQQTPGFGAKV